MDLTVERDGAVATLTLNRPQALNALSLPLKEALLAGLTELAADDAVRAVVLTGAGRAFCAGQDLRDPVGTTSDGTGVETIIKHYNPIVLLLATMPKPVIAAVNGVAAGGGAGLAMAADFRIASRSATFLMAFANIALTLDTGLSWTLPRAVGHARALALAMLAEPITADEALGAGMVNSVVEPEELSNAAHDLASRLAAGPTAAYAAIKRSLAYASGTSLADALAMEGRLQAPAAVSADHRAAVAAFLAKQKPVFTGH